MYKKLLVSVLLLCSGSALADQQGVAQSLYKYLTSRAQYVALINTCGTKSNLSNIDSSRSFAIAYANLELAKHRAFVESISKGAKGKNMLTLDDAAAAKENTNSLQAMAYLLDLAISNPNFSPTNLDSQLYMKLVNDERKNAEQISGECEQFEKKFVSLSSYAHKFLKF